uniref:4-coumarate--CoA ligase n=1 Tax=Elaeophora elaphi TaxID=1147741 RepID=A0A0R3RFD6_9BILA
MVSVRLNYLQRDERTDENLTFNQLRNKSYSFANALKQLDVKKSDIMVVCLENCYQYAIIFLGSALVGCSISGIHPESTQHEIEKALKLTSAKLLIVSSRNYHIAVSCTTQCKLIILDKHFGQFGNDFDSLIRKWEGNLVDVGEEDITLDDILLTPFSSGTTGSSKCVQLTHRNFNFSTAILKQALFDRLSEGCRRVTVGVLPFYHGSGFWALCYCLLEGHQTIIMKRFHPAIMLNCIEKYKIDTINVVPVILESLCHDEIQTERWDLSSLTTVLCGSAPLGKELSKRFLQKFPHVINLIQGYGMTELVVLSHITPLGTPIDDDSYLGSCGKLLPGFEAQLLDEETGAVQREPWKSGELLLRSETIMKGYLNNAEETRKVIDSNRWLHTGDVMYFDSNNFYFVIDRKKDLIKVNGMQVSPAELEDILKCHKNVSDAAVVGVSDKDHGQVPKAFVVLVSDEAVGFQSGNLIKYVNGRVAPHKQLRGGIQIVNCLPKTPSGKISRKDLMNMKS